MPAPGGSGWPSGVAQTLLCDPASHQPSPGLPSTTSWYARGQSHHKRMKRRPGPCLSPPRRHQNGYLFFYHLVPGSQISRIHSWLCMLGVVVQTAHRARRPAGPLTPPKQPRETLQALSVWRQQVKVWHRAQPQLRVYSAQSEALQAPGT